MLANIYKKQSKTESNVLTINTVIEWDNTRSSVVVVMISIC